MTALLHAVRVRMPVRRSTAVWLKRLRKDLDVSQSRVAKVAGVHRNTVGKWEAGETEPTLSQFEQLRIFEKNLRRAKGMR